MELQVRGPGDLQVSSREELTLSALPVLQMAPAVSGLSLALHNVAFRCLSVTRIPRGGHLFKFPEGGEQTEIGRERGAMFEPSVVVVSVWGPD